MAIDKIISASITDGAIATADIADGAVTAVKTTGVGGQNTPYWYAYGHASGQGTTTGTFTKMQASVVHDSGSNYDNSNYRWTCPSGQGGKYWVSMATQPYNTSNVANGAQIVPYKNGNSMGNTYNASLYQVSNFRNHWIMWSGIIDLSAGDYLEAFAYSNFPSGSGGLAYGKFGGYKLIE
jgi:hypothetical protein